jgi:hypothetical protein
LTPKMKYATTVTELNSAWVRTLAQ